MRGDRKIFRSDYRARIQLDARINIKPGRIFEELPQAPEHPAFVVIIKTFVEYFRQLRRAQRQADWPICIAREICGQTMEAAEVGHQHRLAQGAEGIGALKKILLLDHFPSRQVAQRHFHQHYRRLALQLGRADKLFQRALQHIERRRRDRVEAAALNQHRFFVKHLRPLNCFAFGGEHGGLGQPLLHQLQRH